MKSESMFGKKNHPSLKTISNASKPLVSLSKVQFESLLGKETKNIYQKPKKKQQRVNSATHMRVISSLSRKVTHRQTSKTTRGAMFHQRKFQSNKTNTVIHQNTTHTQRNHLIPNLDRAKFSSKSSGRIHGYGVNSHAGPVCTTNQDRVCIVTNLNKTQIRKKQILYFGIYDGKNGSSKAQYYRDHFHYIVYHDEYFGSDLEKAIKRSIATIEKNFAQDHKNNESSVSFVVTIINEQKIYAIQYGQPKLFISSDLGAKTFNPLDMKSFPKQKSLLLNSKIKNMYMHLQSTSKVELLVRGIELNQNFDFMVLGSEGLYQNYTERQISRKIWLQFLKHCPEGINFGIAQTTNSIIDSAFRQGCTKNISAIIITFEGFQKNFSTGSQFKLPYTQLRCIQ